MSNNHVLICPYCGKATIDTGYLADRCKNHPLMVIFCGDNCSFIGDNGYEFELSEHETTLLRYNSKVDVKNKSDHLYMNGYHYTGKNSTIMWEFNERLPITPDNFHRYLNKILNLKAFL